MDHAARVIVRPIASPLPVTLSGLAFASLIVSGQQLGWYTPPNTQLVGWLLLATAVPLQFLAAAWAFTTRSGPATGASSVLGATWLATALTFIFHGPPGGIPDALAMAYFAATVLLVSSAAVQGVMSSFVPAVVIALAGVRFGVSGVSAYAGRGFWEDASGVIGLVVAALAAYAVLALQVEDSAHEEVLPLGRHGEGERSTEDGMPTAMDGIAIEPGVRRTL